MRSISTHSITWIKPDTSQESWEFFSHPAKQEFYRRHGLSWDQIIAASEQGSLTPFPRGDQIAGATVQLSYHRYEDYTTFLAKAKRGYRIPYNRMEAALQKEGQLSLPAPIILRSADEALLFAGYRRLCLAWNYGILPAVWLVSL